MDTKGIFASNVFSGFGQIGLGLINLDQVRAGLISAGRSAADIANIMAWSQKVYDLESKIGDAAARNSTTDATYAHWQQAINPNVSLNEFQKAALAYEAQQQYQRTHANAQIVTAGGGASLTKDVTQTLPVVQAQGGISPAMIAVGVGGAAVLGGVLYFMLRRKKAA